MKHRFDRHPYLVVSLVFAAIAIHGTLTGGWSPRGMAFLLLLYLVVLLGIRLDELMQLLQCPPEPQAGPEIRQLRSEVTRLRILLEAYRKADGGTDPRGTRDPLLPTPDPNAEKRYPSG